ncbi:response regulator transcription factor [Nitratifractor sp.]
MRQKILVVEDDRLFNETLCEFLEEEGYEAVGVYDPAKALEHCYKEQFDLYLLDINLPGYSGIELLRSLRNSGDDTLAILLTSREDRASVIQGLREGADDYLRKPVDLEELSLRIRTLFRRNGGPMFWEFDGCRVDMSSHKVFREGREEELGRKVFDLLVLFLQHAGQTVKTETIASTLWPTAEEASYGAIRVYITRLKKLFPGRIENIRGVGYLFHDEGIEKGES